MRKNTYKPTSKKRKSTEILLKVTKKQNVSRETKKYRGNTKHFLNEKKRKMFHVKQNVLTILWNVSRETKEIGR